MIKWSVDAEDSELFVIHALWVHPMYSGKGIAKQMVQKIIDIACENKIKTIRLDVLGGNIPSERMLCYNYVISQQGALKRSVKSNLHVNKVVMLWILNIKIAYANFII